MKIYFLLAFFIISNLKSQTLITGNFSMKPDHYEAKVLDKSFQNIYYKLEFVRNPKNSDKKQEAICILQIGEKFSKFSDLNKLRTDSLLEKFSHMEKIGAKEFNLQVNLSERWKNVLIKNFAEQKIVVQEDVKIPYQYEEKQPLLEWTLENETKNILGYTCNKATTKYRGRKYTAWYSKDIPINNGPYIFQGLPGLILEVEDYKNQFHFTAIALDKKNQEIYVRNEKNILVVSREQFRKTQKSYFDNPGFFLGNSYDTNGNVINDRLKSRPYNPIELE